MLMSFGTNWERILDKSELQRPLEQIRDFGERLLQHCRDIISGASTARRSIGADLASVRTRSDHCDHPDADQCDQLGSAQAKEEDEDEDSFEDDAERTINRSHDQLFVCDRTTDR
jgi:hypothetical protein